MELGQRNPTCNPVQNITSSFSLPNKGQSAGPLHHDLHCLPSSMELAGSAPHNYCCFSKSHPHGSRLETDTTCPPQVMPLHASNSWSGEGACVFSAPVHGSVDSY